MESPEGSGIHGSKTRETGLGWRYRFGSNLQTMEVKIRQVDELTKGSCVKLLQENMAGAICIKGMGRRRSSGTLRAIES